MPKISTGAAFFDQFLQGGYDNDILTTIYGPSGCGKTNFCLLAAIEVAKTGKKVLFIDTEGGIAVERIKQINPHYQEIIDRIIFFNPTTFAQQKEIFENLRESINEHIGMIIIDSIAMLYRLELGRSEEVYEVNSSLGKQIAALVEIARTKKIPALITNQVYANFDNRSQINMVGGDLLKYGSKCLIELQRFTNCRGLILRKHRSLPEGKEFKFRIVHEGIEEVQ